MQYINLLNKNIDIFPIFGLSKIKNPIFLGMDDSSFFMKGLDNEQIKNQKLFNNLIIEYGISNNSNLIISGFLEKREIMFKALGFNQMVSEKRFYHLGLDLSISKGNSIYTPLDGEIYEVGYEEGNGNYGGYVVLKHNVNGFIFYSLYGHQNRSTLPLLGKYLKAGDQLSSIGDYNDNGGYFHHLHFQLLTQEGIDNGFINKGYIRDDEINDINKYILDPNYLFRF